MTNGIATPTQRMILRPFSQRLYYSDINYSKSYIYNFVNDLTEVAGQDLVILGCKINDSSFTDTDITIEMNTGYLLHDKAFIDLTESELPISITYPKASNFDESGKFILFSRFKNYNNPEYHKMRLVMMYVNSSGISYETFNPETDRIILMTVSFTKDISGNIDGVTVSQENTIEINGSTYSVFPRLDLYMVDGGQLPLLVG